MAYRDALRRIVKDPHCPVGGMGGGLFRGSLDALRDTFYYDHQLGMLFSSSFTRLLGTQDKHMESGEGPFWYGTRRERKRKNEEEEEKKKGKGNSKPLALLMV